MRFHPLQETHSGELNIKQDTLLRCALKIIPTVLLGRRARFAEEIIGKAQGLGDVTSRVFQVTSGVQQGALSLQLCLSWHNEVRELDVRDYKEGRRWQVVAMIL